MNAFKASLAGRIVSLSIAFALIPGGLISVYGLPRWVPYILLTAVGGCLVGMLLAIEKHAGAAAALLIALPMLLWPYSMALIWIAETRPQLGWWLIAAGAGVTVFSIAGLIKRPSLALPEPAKQSAA
jgi:hypothetical protein